MIRSRKRERRMHKHHNINTFPCARELSKQNSVHGGDKMYDLLKRHAVHVLNDAGLSIRSISKQTKMSIKTVWRILRESPIKSSEQKSNHIIRENIGRPPVARKYESQVQAIFEAEPDLPTIEILHRLKEKGYTGSKTPVYELVAKLRPAHQQLVVRFEGLPGEFSQHDFGHVRVKYKDGSMEVIHFFASKLKYSRWAHVCVVPDEKVESLVRALLRAFESFEGIPLVAVFDNPKTIVLKRNAGRIEWNPIFAQVALDLRFAPELCTPGFANQKGAVENLVGWVKNSFFKVRRFHDRDDLLEQLSQWLVEINTKRPSRATKTIPAIRIEEERKRMRSFDLRTDDYPLRYPVSVGEAGCVTFRGIRYSMPPECINKQGTLYLYAQNVEIIIGKYKAKHPRLPDNGDVSMLPAHAKAGLEKVPGRRGRIYYKRQRLLELGKEMEIFMTELVHARPRVWANDVWQLYDTLQTLGSRPLISAVRKASTRKLYGSEYVRAFLQEKVK